MYDELITALRNCADYSDCGICKLNGKSNCADIMMRDAADAIERLGKTIEQQYETIAQLEADLEAAYNH